MPPSTIALQAKDLGKQKMAQVVRRAKRLGMTPKSYLKHLVEEDLAISSAVKTTSFRDLMGPGAAVDEREVDKLVEAAKTKYHRRASRNR